MKNYFLLFLFSLVVLFLFCRITKIDIPAISWNDSFSGEVWTEISGEKLPDPIFSGQTEYLSWYDGPVALITEENKDEVIVMTGEELLYRNEVYGFQVKLGKAWKGVRIYQKQHPWFPSQEGIVHPALIFEMPNPDYSHLRWNVVLVRIMPFSVYQKLYELCKNDSDWFCEPSDYEKARKNNKYYIFVWWNEQHDSLYETFYPYLECEDVVIDWFSSKFCPSAEKQLFSDWEVFDVQ